MSVLKPSCICCVTQHLGELVLSFLNRELQPSCQLACLETVRILTRDKDCLGPFISPSAMSTLARYAGIATAGAATPADSQPLESQGNPCQLSQVLLVLPQSKISFLVVYVDGV